MVITLDLDTQELSLLMISLGQLPNLVDTLTLINQDQIQESLNGLYTKFINDLNKKDEIESK